MQNIKPLEIQVKKLKLNVTNIKSSLINGNKSTKKIRAEEKSLLLSKKRESQKLKKEEFVEGKGITSKIGGAAKNIAAPAMGLIDKIKSFFGAILLGIIVNNLPEAIERFQRFLKDNKWIFDTIKAVFSALEFVVPVFKEIVNFFNPSKREQYDNNKKEIKEKIAALTGDIDALDKEASAVEKELKEEFDAQPDESINRTDDELVEDIKSAIKDQKITEKSFKKSLNDYRIAINNNNKTTKPINIAGVGSFERVSGGLFNMGTKVVTKDTFGREITEETFDERVLTAVGKNKGGSFNDDFLKLAQGGLVRQGATGQEKVALRDAQSFLDLKESALISSKILESQEDTNDEFKKLTDNFKSYLDLTKEEDEETPKANPYTVPANTQGPVQATPTGLPAIAVNPNDVIGTVGFTGNTVPKGPGGSHIHIENMDNYAKGIPAGVKNSILINGVAMPQQLRFTSGIGRRWGRTHRGEDFAGNPDQSITLIGGLKFKRYLPADGSGYGNRVEIVAPDGTTYMLAHLNAGPTNVTELVKRQQAQQAQGTTPTNISPAQVIPTSGSGIQLQPLTPFQQKHLSGGKGGLRRSEQLTQTFDGEGMTEVVIIKSTQPIVVPGPPRYIRR